MRCIVLFLCLAVLCVGAWLIGCDDKPSQPPEPEPEPEDYVFVAFSDRMKMYTYHPETRELDSADVPYRSPFGVTASPDGKRLYIVYIDNSPMVGVLEAGTLELQAQLPYYTREPVAVSPDNKMIAIVGQDLHILSTTDYSEIYSDSNSAAGGVFSADSRSFYCASAGKACRIDLGETAITRTIWDFAGGMVANVEPSPDESLLFAYGHGYPSVLAVYDLDHDTLLYLDTIVPGHGLVKLTPDGAYAFYNSPGTMLPPTADYRLKILDVRSLEVVSELITSTTFNDSLPEYYIPTARMEITPDGRWLALLDAQVRCQMLIFDIQNMAFTDYVPFASSVGSVTAVAEP